MFGGNDSAHAWEILSAWRRWRSFPATRHERPPTVEAPHNSPGGPMSSMTTSSQNCESSMTVDDESTSSKVAHRLMSSDRIAEAGAIE